MRRAEQGNRALWTAMMVFCTSGNALSFIPNFIAHESFHGQTRCWMSSGAVNTLVFMQLLTVKVGAWGRAGKQGELNAAKGMREQGREIDLG